MRAEQKVTELERESYEREKELREGDEVGEGRVREGHPRVDGRHDVDCY